MNRMVVSLECSLPFGENRSPRISTAVQFQSGFQSPSKWFPREFTTRTSKVQNLENPCLVGWTNPSENMSSSIGMIPNKWENTSHVLNHQLDVVGPQCKLNRTYRIFDTIAHCPGTLFNDAAPTTVTTCHDVSRRVPVSSCVAIATKVMICSEPNSMKVHLCQHRLQKLPRRDDTHEIPIQ